LNDQNSLEESRKVIDVKEMTPDVNSNKIANKNKAILPKPEKKG